MALAAEPVRQIELAQTDALHVILHVPVESERAGRLELERREGDDKVVLIGMRAEELSRPR